MKINPREIITNPEKLRIYQKEYYKNLLSSKFNNENASNEKFFTDMPNIPQLTNQQKQSCEGKISIDECSKILKTFSENKSSGYDGMTIEFYKHFWNKINKILVHSYNKSFDKGILTNSQRQAAITLLQKPGKDRLLLQNWRPISLLNLDYKILTKVIGQRIQVVLPDIIHENQSGFVSGRKIEHSVKLIQDIINFTEYKKAKGYFLFIDFGKAFDSIEWNFRFKSLETFNFGN